MCDVEKIECENVNNTFSTNKESSDDDEDGSSYHVQFNKIK